MHTDTEQEVVDVLTADPQDIAFEELHSEVGSPLNRSVKEKQASEKDWNIWKPKIHKEHPEGSFTATEENTDSIPDSPISPLDAPEQEIGEATQNEMEGHSRPEQPEAEAFELPTESAKQAADTFLGMSNNVLAVGGGFFVKIKKHSEFYEFDQIVELIDSQNQKNVKRIQLDKQDKALLKPLLIALLKKKAKKLSPEGQLIGAILSIVLKKAQVVMEVRAENAILVDRILDIVREEKVEQTQSVEEQVQEQTEGQTSTKAPTDPIVSHPNTDQKDEQSASTTEKELDQKDGQEDQAAQCYNKKRSNTTCV